MSATGLEAELLRHFHFHAEGSGKGATARGDDAQAGAFFAASCAAPHDERPEGRGGRGAGKAILR